MHRTLCFSGAPNLKFLMLLLVLLPLSGIARADPAVAFFYGSNPPWDELQSFDIVVVDPDHVPDPGAAALLGTRIAAYVSVGEVNPSRAYAKQIPAQWLVGENRDWGSRVIDQSQPGWPRFFAERVIGPLWRAGYRDFFLDTLDSYQLGAKTPQAREQQEIGLVAVIEEVKHQYPEARLIFNRGFEILDRTHDKVFAIAAESLFQGYDAGKSRYVVVPEQDRAWLLAQLNKAHNEFGLPVIAIDYVPSAQRELARATAKRIEALGFIPWIATPDLASLGVGLVEAMPRRVLLIHSPLPTEYEVRLDNVVRLATMPLNYLGYKAEYVDTHTLPTAPVAGSYAGVVVWLSASLSAEEGKLLTIWLAKCVTENIPVAIVGQVEGIFDTPFGKSLGVTAEPAPAGLERIDILQQAAMMGFERQPHPHLDEFSAISLKVGKPLLTLGTSKTRQVAAAITPWGGYVMSPYAVATLPNQEYWVINPFAFFREALRLPDMPVPDTTTESGRRMLMVHMDGDGFVSRSELPGNPFAGEVVRDRVVRKYRLPMTISVIEAEISPKGLYPKFSAQLEAVARDIFSETNVEIASHSYSHPFNWKKDASASQDSSQEGEGGYSLPVPGYRFDLQREIEGSIRYIEGRLAPPGKKVAIFLWTGDCNPGRDALVWTQRLGVMNMNGGDTIATRSYPTMTRVEGLGVEKQGLFQVFAPNQNENVYTNGWKGPFYGFERVIETFELTEKPRRLKPIDIYFHTYLTTKSAGMKSLDKMFVYALAQETTPVFASEYARKVLNFQHVAIARTSKGSWRIRGATNLRTLRAPASLGEPDMHNSQAVAGFKRQAGVTYIHLSGASADIAFADAAAAEPRLISANAHIDNSAWTEGTMRWQLTGHVPLRFDLANVGSCSVRADGREIVPLRRDGAIFHYQLTAHAARPLEAICRH